MNHATYLIVFLKIKFNEYMNRVLEIEINDEQEVVVIDEDYFSSLEKMLRITPEW